MKTINNPQSELDWKKSRIGFFSGSRIGELMTSGKKKDEIFGKTALTYIYEIAGQRDLLPSYLTDDYLFSIYEEQTSIENKFTRFGKENEDLAVEEYEKRTGNTTETVGSVRHPDIKFFSASPDRIVTTADGKKKILEVKCPSVKVFMQYKSEIKDNETLKAVNPLYFYQTQAEMSVTGLTEADFVAFCPFLRHGIHIVPITRDEAVQEAFAYRIAGANNIIENLLKQ